MYSLQETLCQRARCDIPGCVRSFDEELSQSTKTRIQNVSQTACLLRNSNWVLRYWHDAVTCPDAVQAQYGYVYNARGAVHFDEHASLESLERLELEQE